jgi:hypothetical protein
MGSRAERLDIEARVIRYSGCAICQDESYVTIATRAFLFGQVVLVNAGKFGWGYARPDIRVVQ